MSDEGRKIYNQGYYYYTGKSGYPLNRHKAFEYFKKAAELGVSDAMNYLGLIYEEGEVVTQDYKTAAEWFFEAAGVDEKNPYAAFNLGRMFYFGRGFIQDIPKAYKYCKRAVDLGVGNTHTVYAKSCHLVGCALLHHYNNPKESYPYFIEAAKYGNIAEAWHNLGWLSEQGVVPLKNPGTDAKASRDGMAKDFYEEAAQLGCVESMDALGRLYITYNMTNEATMWLQKAASKGYEPAKKRLKYLNASQSGSIWELFGGLFG